MKSKYPHSLANEFELEYLEDEKNVVISHKMPNPEEVPRIIEYKYIKARNETEIKKMKQVEFDKFYDNIIYQITLKIIYEVYNSVYSSCIKEIIVNGWVEYVDKATGNNETSCIISIKVSKEDFEKIDFMKIDYKECVKRLKGIFAGKLISLIHIKPILNLSREDSRFIDNKDVLSNMENGTNLALMPWEDFEHLVRQLFEKKFSNDGAEVKITQASRDGGVDAIAFDSDPLRGGKFIIQAKRYNGVVPASAVRDLYGTIMHEQAVRGILVTTSDYGNDSYALGKVKGK